MDRYRHSKSLTYLKMWFGKLRNVMALNTSPKYIGLGMEMATDVGSRPSPVVALDAIKTAGTAGYASGKAKDGSQI